MAWTTKSGTEFDPLALERTEIRFRREVWDAVPHAVAFADRVRSAEFGPIQATVLPPLPEAPGLNLMLGGASGDAAAEGFLDEAIGWVRGEGARGFALLTPDLPGTPAAEATLGAAGYVRADGWMRFVRDDHPTRFAVADDVEVVEVEGTEADGPFATIAALGLGLPAWVASLLAPLPGLPDWRCYLARVDGESRACAAMLLDGEVAELGFAAALEGGRRRDCRLALLHRQIEDAAAAGVRTLFTDVDMSTAGDQRTAVADIRGAGFEAAYLCPGWSDARPAAG